MSYRTKLFTMCGRMNINDHEGIQEFLASLETPLDWNVDDNGDTESFAQGYNIAPGSLLKLMYFNQLEGRVGAAVMSWGIKPSWEATSKQTAKFVDVCSCRNSVGKEVVR